MLLNAAAALVAADGTPPPEQLTEALAGAMTRAAEAVDAGAAMSLLDRWVTATRRLRPA